MRWSFVILMGFCLFSAGTGQARMGDISCDDSARLADMLVKDMGAHQHGMGLRDPETMLAVWVTPRNGDWVIVQTYTNGTSCIVAMGAHWEGAVAVPAPSPPESLGKDPA